MLDGEYYLRRLAAEGTGFFNLDIGSIIAFLYAFLEVLVAEGELVFLRVERKPDDVCLAFTAINGAGSCSLEKLMRG